MTFRNILTSLILLFVFTVDTRGREFTHDDSISVTQLYETKNAESSQNIRFSTEELSLQYHDGQEVFSNKRKVEYSINRSKNKITIKRHVLSSENSTQNKNKKLLDLYPDVTSSLLSAVLTPRKFKADTQHYVRVANTAATEKDNNVLIIDKLTQHPIKEDSFMETTLKFQRATEKLCYTSLEHNYFDLLKTILSQINIEMTDKQGEKHHIQITENVTLLF